MNSFDQCILEVGRKVTADMVRAMMPEELAKVKTVARTGATSDLAAKFFEEISTSNGIAAFLTLPLYEEI
jgi:malate synthase